MAPETASGALSSPVGAGEGWGPFPSPLTTQCGLLASDSGLDADALPMGMAVSKGDPQQAAALLGSYMETARGRVGPHLSHLSTRSLAHLPTRDISWKARDFPEM